MYTYYGLYFLCKQERAYEMRISDWSADVCSSDLNDPSVRTSRCFGNASEQFVIRGFPLYGEDIAIDGLYGVTPRQLVSPELYDQVQVLNGASAFLFGAAPGGSARGGTVNLQPKRARDKDTHRVNDNYLQDSPIRGAFAFGHRLGAAGSVGIR